MNGLLVTAKYGAAVRLGAVMTDMPVPQAEQIENPCRRCGCCVRACPSGALYGTAWKDKTPVQDILDVQLCSAYMKKTYHWVNDDVKIDFKLPNMIQDLVDELEEMDQNEDWSYFDRCDFIENITKEFVINKEMTSKQRDILCERYRGG